MEACTGMRSVEKKTRRSQEVRRSGERWCRHRGGGTGGTIVALVETTGAMSIYPKGRHWRIAECRKMATEEPRIGTRKYSPWRRYYPRSSKNSPKRDRQQSGKPLSGRYASESLGIWRRAIWIARNAALQRRSSRKPSLTGTDARDLLPQQRNLARQLDHCRLKVIHFRRCEARL